MSEIISNKQQKGKRKALSTRVDLTPMVDLGFLLITFFVFTTSLSQAKVLKLNLPADDISHQQAPESGALTLVTDENKVWYYKGKWEEALLNNQFTAVDYHTIRKVIMDLKHALIARKGHDDDMVVMIKSTPRSTFGNTINILDEMLINGIRRYVIMDISKDEQLVIDQHPR